MNEIKVFVYGSLLPGHSNHHVVSPYVTSSTAGQIAARLVDCGSYPAAVRDSVALESGGCIRGQWITVDRQGLARMDELEDFIGIEEPGDYDRVWVRDALDASLEGWVYVWESERGCPAIPDSYWPDYWARKSGSHN